MTRSKKPWQYQRLLVRIGLYICLLLVFIAAVFIMQNRNIQRQKETLETAIQKDITAEYAAEGKYPDSVEEIQERYGLIYDEKKFHISYEVRGGNIRPYVTIIVRKGDDHE